MIKKIDNPVRTQHFLLKLYWSMPDLSEWKPVTQLTDAGTQASSDFSYLTANQHKSYF